MSPLSSYVHKVLPGGKPARVEIQRIHSFFSFSICVFYLDAKDKAHSTETALCPELLNQIEVIILATIRLFRQAPIS